MLFEHSLSSLMLPSVREHLWGTDMNYSTGPFSFFSLNVLYLWGRQFIAIGLKLMALPFKFRNTIPDISDKEFDDCLSQSSIPVIVEFWKPGCSHCLSLLRELERLQVETLNQLAIVKMNVEENHIIPADLEIYSLPSLALFVHGEFQQFIGGIGRKDELLRQLSPWLTPEDS